jgi:hypothetical protein
MVAIIGVAISALSGIAVEIHTQFFGQRCAPPLPAGVVFDGTPTDCLDVGSLILPGWAVWIILTVFGFLVGKVAEQIVAKGAEEIDRRDPPVA